MEMIYGDLSKKIIGAAIEVHRHLGPGLLESVYQAALDYELRLAGIKSEREVPIPVVYKGLILEVGFRADIIVEDRIIIELKATDGISKLHKKQLLTYLKAANMRLGLLFNFNETTLMDGFERLVN